MVKQGRLVGARVSIGNKEEMLQQLAVSLAEHFSNASLFQANHEAFRDRATVDEAKARELDSLILQVDERRALREAQARGEDVQIKERRMDPLDTYDPTALRMQRDKHLRQAEEFRKRSLEEADKAQDSRKAAEDTQRKIIETRAAKDEYFDLRR